MKEPELVEADEFLVMGIETTTSRAAEADFATARIPKLWGAFFSGQFEDKIPHRKDPNQVLGVYADHEMDPKNQRHGSYAVIAGCEVTAVEEVPEGLVAMPVPAGKYLLFEARGPMPDTLVQTWDGIWQFFEKTKDYQRAFTVDFDVYHKDRPDAVDIFVAVK
jgi:predicted transcriptional regulator YdeE